MPRLRSAVELAAVAIALTAGCGADDDPALPTTDNPPPAEADRATTDRSDPDEVRWPSPPQGLPGEAARCAEEYRAMAARGLPPLGVGGFDAWYRGPFQRWTAGYNEVRGRCDEVFAALPPQGDAAQVVLASQSVLHERLAAQAQPLDDEAQMFVMATYWRLGAACTYQSCAAGPLEDWRQLCERRRRPLPPCPAASDGAE